MLAFATAGVVVYVTAVVLRLDYRSLTYQITFPIIALGLIFLTLQNTKPFAMPMYSIGFQYFYIILWSAMAFNGAREDTPAGWLFACGMFFLQVGQTGGAALGSWIVSSRPGGGTLPVVVEFALLAMRYDRPRICEALTIGDETAKTHIKHIYQKLGIHSRDELQELLAREAEEIRRNNYGL